MTSLKDKTKNFRERFGFLYKLIERFAVPNAKETNWGEEIESFLLAYGEKCREEEQTKYQKQIDAIKKFNYGYGTKTKV